MARPYRLNLGTRLVNWILAGMTRGREGTPYRHILTVRGRRTGRLHSTPVDVIEPAGHRWLVAGYGLSSWTLNARPPAR
jgi:F420H(2)-dependent quinone reductase